MSPMPIKSSGSPITIMDAPEPGAPSSSGTDGKAPVILAASRRKRIMATFIDGTVMLMLFFFMLVFGIAIGNFEWLPGPARLMVDVIYVLLLLGAGPAYLVFGLKNFKGTTPGKWVLGMQVLRSDDREISMGLAFVREVVVKLWFFGLSLNALLIVSALFSLRANRQTAHDWVLGTRVVRRNTIPAPAPDAGDAVVA